MCFNNKAYVKFFNLAKIRHENSMCQKNARERKRNNVTGPNCYCAGIACDKCNPIGNREGVMESTPSDR